MRVLIVGGGVIGLSIGWRLARKGYRVELFDRGKAGYGASRAAAGMLSPYAEAHFDDVDLFNLGVKSLELYPQFLSELSLDANMQISFESQGTLLVGIDRDDRAYLERIYRDKLAKNFPIEWISPACAREKEPLLSPRISSAIYLPKEQQIDNRRLIAALITAFKNQGGMLHEETLFDSKLQKSDDLFIDATGAWNSDLRIRPNKGQILTLRMTPTTTLSSVIRSPRIYLVPKQDGTLRVGATSEEVGFDDKIMAGAIRELLDAAFEIVPACDEMAFVEAIASFRPATQDGLPLIEEKEGNFLVAGHGRSGILLAPYTADQILKKIGHHENQTQREVHFSRKRDIS